MLKMLKILKFKKKNKLEDILDDLKSAQTICREIKNTLDKMENELDNINY